MYSPEMLSKITAWRNRAAGNGEPMTTADWREVYAQMREGRVAASAASASGRSRSSSAKGASPVKAPIDTTALKAKLLGKK